MGGVGSKTKKQAGPIFGTKKVQYSVVVVGIDGAGKTTIINHLRDGSSLKSGEQPPTIGCNIENLRHGNVGLTVIDMAGGSKYRSMWQNYYQEVEGVVFVIDSADALRMAVAREEFQEMLAHDAIKASRVPILILANKMDLPKSMPHQEIADALDLVGSAFNHSWKVMHCCGLTAEGVQVGWDWLVEQMKRRNATR